MSGQGAVRPTGQDAVRPTRRVAQRQRQWPAASPPVDPYQALSYMISGVGLWGLIGWGMASWLDMPALIGVGLVIGGVLGVVGVWLRYGRPIPQPSPEFTPAPRAVLPTGGPGSVQPPSNEETL